MNEGVFAYPQTDLRELGLFYWPASVTLQGKQKRVSFVIFITTMARRRRRSIYETRKNKKLVPHTFPPGEWQMKQWARIWNAIEHWENETDPRFTKTKFRTVFDGLLDYIIHPTMIDLAKQLRDKRMGGKQLRSYREGYFPQEHFHISPGEYHRVYFRLSFFGNMEEECIDVRLTFFTNVRDPEWGNYVPQELLVTNKAYAPLDISPDLCVKLVNKGIWQARRVGKEWRSRQGEPGIDV